MRARCSGGFRSPMTRAAENNAKEQHGNHDRIGTSSGLSGRRSTRRRQQPSPSDAPITIREMMEAGVHFGHQTKRWNPKMKSFIFGARNGIHIIDLQQTVRAFKRAYNFLVQNVAQGRSVLFVGTKKQAQEVMRDEAHARRPVLRHQPLAGRHADQLPDRQGIDRPPARHREDVDRRHLRAHDQEGGPRRHARAARSWRRRWAASRA